MRRVICALSGLLVLWACNDGGTPNPDGLTDGVRDPGDVTVVTPAPTTAPTAAPTTAPTTTPPPPTEPAECTPEEAKERCVASDGALTCDLEQGPIAGGGPKCRCTCGSHGLPNAVCDGFRCDRPITNEVRMKFEQAWGNTGGLFQSSETGASTFEGGVAFSDGSLILAGNLGNGTRITKVTAGGKAVDTTFGNAGVVDTTVTGSNREFLIDIARSADDFTVVDQVFNGTISLPRARRFTFAGAPVTTFGASGSVNVTLPTGTFPHGIALAPDNGFVIAAHQQPVGEPFELVLLRYDAKGKPVTSFSNSGVLVANPDGLNMLLRDVGFASDGSIVVVGSLEGTLATPAAANILVAKYDGVTGAFDPKFNGGKVLQVDFGAFELPTWVKTNVPGRIYFGGLKLSTSLNGDAVIGCVDLTGVPCPDVGTNGQVVTNGMSFTNMNAPVLFHPPETPASTLPNRALIGGIAPAQTGTGTDFFVIPIDLTQGTVQLSNDTMVTKDLATNELLSSAIPIVGKTPRVVFTGSFSDTSAGRAGAISLSDDTFGLTSGVQMESWW